MSNILVINSGSSSIKFQLINTDTEKVIMKGAAKNLLLPFAHIEFQLNDEKTSRELPYVNHTDALAVIFDHLRQVNLLDSITAVGHRIVHGGETFRESKLITEDVLQGIKDAIPFAPLHNPANLLGVEAVSAVNPDLAQVAVFDTAFHATMPAEAYRYAVPANWYKDHGVRRYGFHGTSYRFITEKAAKILGRRPEETNLIICHLGSGASAAAIEGGKSIATTMGFTPLAGLPMETRSGNIDPGIIPYVMEKENLSVDEVLSALNKSSGYKATSEISDNMRDIIIEAESGNQEAQLAIDIFSRKVAKYIAGFMTTLPRLDGLVFTAGIGEDGANVRANIVDRLKIFGFRLSAKKNEVTRAFRGTEGLISTKSSTYPIYALMTNEELMIAKDTAHIVKAKK